MVRASPIDAVRNAQPHEALQLESMQVSHDARSADPFGYRVTQLETHASVEHAATQSVALTHSVLLAQV
jgi:hypothetical protein